jgi:hypothetical protein
VTSKTFTKPDFGVERRSCIVVFSSGALVWLLLLFFVWLWLEAGFSPIMPKDIRSFFGGNSAASTQSTGSQTENKVGFRFIIASFYQVDDADLTVCYSKGKVSTQGH